MGFLLGAVRSVSLSGLPLPLLPPFLPGDRSLRFVGDSWPPLSGNGCSISSPPFASCIVLAVAMAALIFRTPVPLRLGASLAAVAPMPQGLADGLSAVATRVRPGPRRLRPSPFAAPLLLAGFPALHVSPLRVMEGGLSSSGDRASSSRLWVLVQRSVLGRLVQSAKAAREGHDQLQGGGFHRAIQYQRWDRGYQDGRRASGNWIH